MASSSNKKSYAKRNVDLSWVSKYLRDGVYPPGLSFSDKRMVRKRAERFCFWKDELYYLGTPTDQSLGKKTRKVLLTEEDQWDKVKECHIDEDGTHLGLERTAENIMGRYHWNGIYKFIKTYIRQCKTCLERHPKMFARRGRCTSGEQDLGSDLDFGDDSDSGADNQDDEMKFWSKVDMRVLGPYPLPAGDRMVLIAVDDFSHWVEPTVLDEISADSVANSLLQMICRYGKMGCLTISQDSYDLKEATLIALQSLKDNSDMQIPFQNDAPRDTDYVFKKADEFISGFITANVNTWPEKIEFCLLPLRMSKHQKQPVVVDKLKPPPSTSTSSTEEEMNKAAEALMSVHKAPVGTTIKSPVNTGSTPTNVRGIVTRSRTGNTKPKPFDEDDYEVPTPKRKAGISVVVQNSPPRKKQRSEPQVTPGTPVIDISTEVGPSSSREIEPDNTRTPVKKIVDLDTYYEAIKMFLSGEGFTGNATPSFKRLVRDQSKNYTMKEGLLFHVSGPNEELKKVITTKAERLDIMTQSLLPPWSKVMMNQSLENCHWKGKMIDYEAFLLACPNNDKTDINKPLKDVSCKNPGEIKRQLAYDTNDTYKEISNYTIYDVFSNDEASKRLTYLQRQIKNFKMEDGELVHVYLGKKHKILTTAKERQNAITKAHLKKGQHADVSTTFHQLSESYFWFGMKYDVKIYNSLCCSNDTRHMVDRYFLFREHLMKQPLIEKSTDKMPEEIVQTNVIEFVTDDLHISEVTEDDPNGASVDVQTVKPAGIFTSSMKYVTDPVQPTVSSEPSPAVVSTQTVVTETGDIILVTEAGDSIAQEEQSTIQEDTPEEEDTIDVPSETILVKITEDGQAIIMREDGTDPTTGIPVSEHITEVVHTSSSEDVNTAVKSILQDTGAMQTMYKDLPTVNEQISQTVLTETSEQPHTESMTAEDGTNTDMIVDEGGDSDNWMYGSDDDDDDDDEPQYSVLETMMQNKGDKPPATPRPHFKCCQCNKIFYGPLKFKMHMYKHTGQKPFPCNLCNKKYTNKKSLVLHQKTHTGELPYLCSLCGKRCPSKISLKSHLKCHDGNGGGFPAKCDICDRMFSRKHLMERHKLHKHTNLQTEFRCNECNKVFSHQRSLKRHFMSTHLNIKNHACGLCGKTFYRKEYLTGHLIQHGGAAAEGLTPRKPRPSTFKPRPSVFNRTSFDLKEVKTVNGEQFVALQDDEKDDEGVERIILTQDEDGQYRVVDMATEREVKRMLEAQGINRAEAGETMVVHIEEPNGESQVVHVEHTEEQVVEVPIEEHGYIEYQHVGDDKPQEYVITESGVGTSSSGQFIYTSNSNEVSMSGNQELIYGQPAVQYEVECVGDVGDEEALSAINLLAQASAQQYENVISQI